MKPKAIPADRATVSIKEAAAILGIGLVPAYQAAQRGEIPTVRFGRRILVPKKALERLLDGDLKLAA